MVQTSYPVLLYPIAKDGVFFNIHFADSTQRYRVTLVVDFGIKIGVTSSWARACVFADSTPFRQ